MPDHDTQRVYYLHEFTEALLISPDQAYYIAGKIVSADRLYLVLEWAGPDANHGRRSTVPVLADGAGGSPIE